jgi:hypothetical protein
LAGHSSWARTTCRGFQRLLRNLMITRPMARFVDRRSPRWHFSLVSNVYAESIFGHCIRRWEQCCRCALLLAVGMGVAGGRREPTSNLTFRAIRTCVTVGRRSTRISASMPQTLCDADHAGTVVKRSGGVNCTMLRNMIGTATMIGGRAVTGSVGVYEATCGGVLANMGLRRR